MIHDRTRILFRTEALYKSCVIGGRHEEAVCGLDLCIRQGEYVLLRGINGAQKKAFFNLLGCLERPDSGKYYFDYEDVALAGDEVLNTIRRNKIGYLFRDFRLIDRLTVRSNVEVPMLGMDMPFKQKNERVGKVLSEMGIESIADERVFSLSNYDRQLAALARAIVNSPLAIMADEPAANLDKAETGMLMAKLGELNDLGISILIFQPEDITSLQHSCRIITLEKGCVHSDLEETGTGHIDGGAV